MFQIRIQNSARKKINSLPITIRKRIIRILESLEANPRPRGVQKLQGTDNVYRLRSGDYRILYEIQETCLLVTIVKIAHRRESYR